MKSLYDAKETEIARPDMMDEDIANIVNMANMTNIEIGAGIGLDTNTKEVGPIEDDSGFPEVMPQGKGLSRVLKRLPALPRFEDKAQKRAGGNIIKFLAGLLALTLIARGTSGATLARVGVTAPQRNEIVESVTGKATVTSRDRIDVIAPEGLTIMEMLVGAGQSVEVGDAVALFDMEELGNKLIRESAALDKLRLDLDKLDRGDNNDSVSVENALRSLRRTQEDYNTTKAQGESDIKDASDALAEKWAEVLEDPDAGALENALRSLNRVKEDYNATLEQGIANVASAQTALSDAIAADDTEVDSNALDSAKRNRDRTRADYNDVKAQGDASVKTAKDALESAALKETEMEAAWEADKTSAEAEENYLAAKAEKERAQTTLDATEKKAAEDLLSAARKLEDAETSYVQATENYEKNSDQAIDSRQNAIDRARDTLASEEKKAEENLLSAARRLEDAEISYASAKKDYDKNVEKASENKLTALDSAQSALDSARKRADENLLSAARRLEDAEISLESAQRDSSKNALNSADTAASNLLSAATLRLDIEEKEIIVDALALLVSDDGVLYSDIEGVVMSAKPEGGVTGKDALIAFMDSVKGFEAYILLDTTNADKLSIGDDCQVSAGGGSMYYNPTVTSKILAIGLPDEQDRVRVTISLPDGDWSEGQSVDIRVTQSRATYDQCVPISAVKSDNTGYYLLTVEQKNTILGTENILVRTAVNILAADDDNAAIQGSAGRNSRIVSSSNKAVAAGDRVRIED
ncbi:MAG: hypothetical protein FWH57_09475 [Oscillospiraceae bacterium]|nr:hypothetical protein [Oscillospiraceae bacterium]